MPASQQVSAPSLSPPTQSSSDAAFDARKEQSGGAQGLVGNQAVQSRTVGAPANPEGSGDPGAEPPSEGREAEELTPLEIFKAAVAAKDAPGAMTAFHTLSGDEQEDLTEDSALLKAFVALEPVEQGPGILRQVFPEVQQWLAIADAQLGRSVDALREVLSDVGLTGAGELPEFVSQIRGFLNVSGAEVLRPLLTAAGPDEVEACLDDDATVLMLRERFTEFSVFSLFPCAMSTPDLALAVFEDSPCAAAWLKAFAEVLASRIVEWQTGADWVRALWAAKADDTVLSMVQLDPAAWANAFIELLDAPTADVVARFPFGGALAIMEMQAIGGVSPPTAGQIGVKLGWSPMQILMTAIAGSWLTPESVREIFTGPDATFESQLAAASDPLVCALLGTLGNISPLAVFPLLAADSAAVAKLYRESFLFARWMNVDLPALAAYIVAGAAWDGWAYALLTPFNSSTLFRLAKDNGDDLRKAVDKLNAFPMVLAMAPATVEDEATYRGFFNLWGDGTGRTATQAIQAFAALAGARIMPEGEETMFDEATNVMDAAHADSPNRWKTRSVVIPRKPTDAAAIELMKMIRPMSRNEVAATRTVVFAAVKEHRWWQTGPTKSNQWHKWAPNHTTPLVTSYFTNANVVMRVPSAGDAGATQGMDITPTDVDANGTARMVGAGTNANGSDQRTLGDDSLTYFQNHARHEFGHSVGAAEYPGMGMTGDAAALKWAGWTKEDPTTFQRAMWAASGPVLVPMGGGMDTTVPAADIAAWATSILQTGKEPTGTNAMVRDGLLGTMIPKDKLAALMKSSVGGQKLLAYLQAVLNSVDVGGAPDNAYQFTNYVPAGDVHIYASRYDSSFARYSKAAYDGMIKSHGWYSLASPSEMFAEIYTKKYSGKPPPGELNGVNWTSFFDQLEAAGPASKPSGSGTAADGPKASDTPSGQTAGTGAVSGEVAPPTSIVA